MNVPDVARMDSPDVLKMPEKGKEEVESLTKISVSDMKSESTHIQSQVASSYNLDNRHTGE